MSTISIHPLPAGSSPQISTVFTFIHHINIRDLGPVWQNLLADDFKHQTLPLSLGRPQRGKEELTETYKMYFNLIPDFNAEVLDFVEGNGKVWVYAKSTGHAPLLNNEKYSNSYALMFDLITDSDGVKITSFGEFLDSAHTKDYVDRLLAAAKAATSS